MNSRELARFNAKIAPLTDFGKCWPWIGAYVQAKVAKYGQFYLHGKTMLAHRAAYMHWKGTIPHGLTVDHICRNTLCVNPMHLRLLTLKENILAGEGVTAKRARRTACPLGHPYKTRTFGNRIGMFCKTCNNAEDRRYRKEKRPWTIKKKLGGGGNDMTQECRNCKWFQSFGDKTRNGDCTWVPVEPRPYWFDAEYSYIVNGSRGKGGTKCPTWHPLPSWEE